MRVPTSLAATGWALKATWEVSPRLTVAFVALAVLRSVTAPGIALVARGLINTAVDVTRHPGQGLAAFAPWLAAAFGLAAAEALLPVVGRYCRERLADDLGLAMTGRVFEHGATLDVAALESAEHREIVDQAQQDAASLLPRFITELEIGITSAAQTVLLGALLAHVEPWVLLVVVPLAVPYILAEYRRTTAKRAKHAAQHAMRRWSRYFASLLLAPRSRTEIRLLGLAPLFLERSRELLVRLRDEHRAAVRDDFVLGGSFALLTTIGLYAVFVRLAWRVVGGAATVGDVAVFAAASPRLRAALDRAIRALQSLLEQTLAIERLMAFFQLKPHVTSGHGPVPSTDRGELRIEDVWFAYPGARRPALAGISLTLRKGEIVALVGPNGAGKTTLLKLIARVYDPDRGRILLDEADLRSWPLEEIQRRVAIVSQEPVRFEATAVDNVAYGDWPCATEDERRIRTAVSAAGAASLIDRLPRGYETMLGEAFGEHNLSGGQWQRMALARAFLRECPILLLDEPTAQLDAVAINGLNQRLRELAKRRTTLLVSHRLETLLLADRILVMEDGRITRSVTHADLLDQGDSRPPLFTEEA